MKSSSLTLLMLGHLVHGFQQSDCSPNMTDVSGTVIPPCISIDTIETLCQPNGTEPADFLASAQCMCSPPSSFFADWIACRNCLYVHGGLTQFQLNQVSVILKAASTSMCTGTPTVRFAAIYSSAQTAGAAVTTGATTLLDQYPGNPAVSLYYTPTGPQGTGVFGGRLSDGALAASTTPMLMNLASGTAAAKPDRATIPSLTKSDSSVSGPTPKPEQTTTTSKGEAAPTGAFLPGIVAMVAGGMVIAGL